MNRQLALRVILIVGILGAIAAIALALWPMPAS